MARPPALSAEQVAAALADLPEWSGDAGGIQRTVQQHDFQGAVDAIVEIAALAEELDHHPDIDLRWRTLRLSLLTHSAGGVTELDLELARRIDDLFTPLAERPGPLDPVLQHALDVVDSQFRKAARRMPGQPGSGA
jgi:4a-hydroxytetrahydrobiopterin dehydratase